MTAKFLIEFLLFSTFVFLPLSSATSKAELLQYLSNIRGTSTISGQDVMKWFQTAKDITGKYPGLWGEDFFFQDLQNRPGMINEGIKQWNAGSLVTLSWHMCPPTVGDTCNWDDQGILSHLNDDQWADLIRDGGDLNNKFKARLDTVVPFFRQLEDAGVIVVWRPIHEMNEGWSWWGGRPGSSGSRRLYQITHEYMTQNQGLKNIIWNWNVKDVDMGNVDDYYPGPDYADMVSLDIWVNKYARDEDYRKMIQIANGKPIAMGEVGAIPTPDLLASQSEWVWFMIWAEWLKNPDYNTDDGIKQTYYDRRVLSQGDIHI